MMGPESIERAQSIVENNYGDQSEVVQSLIDLVTHLLEEVKYLRRDVKALESKDRYLR